jgi:hypothetical protein
MTYRRIGEHGDVGEASRFASSEIDAKRDASLTFALAAVKACPLRLRRYLAFGCGSAALGAMRAKRASYP